MTVNKSKVNMLLIYPDYYEEANSASRTGGSYAEGLASISAVLKEAGHNVSLMHLLYTHNKEEFLKKFKEYDCDIVGFSLRTTAFQDVELMTSWIKEVSDCFIYCGSYHAILVPEECLQIKGMDAVCVGEGEYPLRELCNKFASGDYYDIQSMWFKKPDGEFIKNPVQPLIEDLDELPFPDYDLFDFDNLEHMRMKTALVMLSRGCLFSCTYCGNSQFRAIYPNRRKYARFRSPENAMNLLRRLLKRYPDIEFINFRDAIFNMYDDWFYEFIEMYIKEIKLPFTCNLRLDIMTEQTVIKLKEAGCYLIDVGVETGNDHLRNRYLKRGMNNEQMIKAFSWFHKHNIRTLTYNIVGLPHENLKLALETVKINVDLNPDSVIPNIFYPYPMTNLAAIAKKAGFVPDVIPPGTKVPLVQKDFPEHQVLFVANYFMSFIRAYKFARRLPSPLSKWYEKYLDFVFTGPLTPRKLWNLVYDIRMALYNALKRFIIEKTPKFYLWLKKRRIKKREKKNAKSEKYAKKMETRVENYEELSNITEVPDQDVAVTIDEVEN